MTSVQNRGWPQAGSKIPLSPRAYQTIPITNLMPIESVSWAIQRKREITFLVWIMSSHLRGWHTDLVSRSFLYNRVRAVNRLALHKFFFLWEKYTQESINIKREVFNSWKSEWLKNKEALQLEPLNNRSVYSSHTVLIIIIASLFLILASRYGTE